MQRLNPELLLQEYRSGLAELEFYGYIVLCDKNKNFKRIGKTENLKFFHRSCAKPLQASIIEKYKTKEFFNLTDEEIAVCCASHSGEQIHTNLVKSVLAKAGLTEKDLKCPIIEPLSKEEQKNTNEYTPAHNNCSGKHALMLAVCKQNGLDIKNYLDINHPLQKEIYTTIQKLCKANYELPSTLDGCLAPIWATSLEELALGFWNLFFSKNYPSIVSAFNVNPYIFGGENRLDTQIMQMNNQLKAKVGAGGLCCVANSNTQETLCFKIIDADMKARSIVVIETLIMLDWININSIDKKLLNNTLNKIVTTEDGQNIGEYKTVFDISQMF